MSTLMPPAPGLVGTSTAASVAPPGETAAAPGGAQAGAFTARDFWRVIRRHIWLIIAMFIICSALTVVVTWLWLRYLPEYTAESYLWGDSPVPQDVFATARVPVSTEVIQRFLLSHAMMVKSNQVLFAAMKDPEVRATSWYKKFRDNVPALMDHLDQELIAAPVRDTEFIRVALPGKEKRELHKVVNAVVDSYMERVRDQATTEVRDTIEALREQLKDVESTITTKKQDLADFIDLAQIPALTDKRGVIFKKLGDYMALKIAAEDLLIEAQAHYESVREEYEAEPDKIPSTAQVSVEDHPTIRYLQQRMTSLQEELGQLLQEYGPEHRVVREVRMRMDAVRREYESRRSSLLKQLRESVVEDAQKLLSAAQAKFIETEDKYNIAKAEQLDLDQKLTTYETYKADIERAEQMYEKIDERMKELHIQQRTPKSIPVRIGTRAVIPDFPSMPKWKVNLPIGCVLGVLVGVLLAFALEMANDTLRSPTDVGRRLSLPILGAIPQQKDDDIDVPNLAAVVVASPYSLMAEGYRQLRTNLLYSNPAHTPRVLLVTSCSEGCGKSTVASNLAMALAVSEKRVLLVDANFRKPWLTQVFPDLPEKGLSDMLAGHCEPDEMIASTQLPNLYFAGAGPAPPNPPELLGSPRVRVLIEHARENFDFVIMDGPPGLLVSDARALATAVDGVLVVVHASVTPAGVVARLRDELRKVHARIIGVVLNRVRTTGGGYFKENYRAYYNYLSQQAMPPAAPSEPQPAEVTEA